MTSLSENTVVTTSGGLVELGYTTASTTVNITATGGTTVGTTTGIVGPVTVVCDGSPVIVEFYVPYAYPAAVTGAFVNFVLFKDGAFAGFVASTQTPAASTDSKTIMFNWRDIPTAGIHTFEVRAYRDAGAGTAQAIGSVAGGWASTFIRVSKVVQASQFIVPLASAPLVTSLPSAPIDGQEIRYVADATNGVIWNLRYRAASSSSYKWEFIGGSPYRVGTTSSEATSSTTYTTLASGPQILIPLAGDYSVYTECQMASGSTGSGAMAYDVGATTANDIDAIWSQVSGPGYSNTGSVIRTKTISTAGTILTMKYKSPQSVSVFFVYRYFQITPIRVG